MKRRHLWLAVGIRFERFVARLAGRLPLLSPAVPHLEAFLAQVRAVGRQPSVLIAVAGIVLAYALRLAAAYRGFFGVFAGVDVGLASVFATVTMIAVLSNVPVTVNGIGLREQLHYFLFAGLVVRKEISVSMSLLMFAHVLVLSLADYLPWARSGVRERA